MARIAVVYSTVDGHTIEICNRLKEVAAASGHEGELLELTPESSLDLDSFDRIVIGASIRYGKHRPEVVTFIESHQALLEGKHAAFFSVNAVARKPEKRDPETNPYVRKFFSTLSWQPSVVGVFGGRIDYSLYGFVDRTMIRFIMWMTKGPTDLNTKVDFTDWDAVKRFGEAIVEEI
jgi:menaquinone-dependent protoporphyrinogen oxidase